MPAIAALVGVGLLFAGAVAMVSGSKSEEAPEPAPKPTDDPPTKELTDETVEFFRKVATKEIDDISSELGGMSEPKPSASLIANLRNNAAKSTNPNELREDAKILMGYKFEKAAAAFAALAQALEGKPVFVAGFGSSRRRSPRRSVMLSSTRGR